MKAQEFKVQEINFIGNDDILLEKTQQADENPCWQAF